jgi:hypothetical protein
MAPQELPKISAFTQLLATPESQFESMVKSAGLELPPGPQSTLLKIQGSIEAGKAPAPEAFMPRAPKLQEILGKLPALPPLPGAGGEGKAGGEKKAEYQLSGEKEKPKIGYVMSR